MTEKRQAERIPILGALHGEIMVFEPMAVTELGPLGATVETRFPLHLNSLHDLRLILGARSIIVKGRVVHSCISDVDQDIVTYRSGMEFVEVSEHVNRAMSDFLDALKINRSGV